MAQRFVVILLCFAVFTGCKKDIASNLSINNLIETAPHIQKAVTLELNGSIGGFYEALPSRYSETNKDYPLLISFHGAGQLGNAGNQLPLVLNDGIAQLIFQKKFPPNFSVQGKNFSFVVLSPQFNKNPSLEEVDEFIQYAKTKYRIDIKRIYLAGLSMGGFITSRIAAANPSQFAAIVPVSGAENDTAVCRSIAQGKLPVWAFHNRYDPEVNVTGTQDFITLLNGFKPDISPRLTVFNASRHDAWTAAFDPNYKEEGVNIYEWMLQYTR